MLEKLTSDVDIKAFFPGGDYAPLKELLVEYRTISRHIRYEFIDPDKQPDVAKQYDVTVYGTFQNPFTGSQLKFGTVVLTLRRSQKKRLKSVRKKFRKRISPMPSSKLDGPKQESLFRSGPRRKRSRRYRTTGYSEAKKALESQGYNVGTVNLASEGKVPADAKVLIIAGADNGAFPPGTPIYQRFSQSRDPEACSCWLIRTRPRLSIRFLKAWGVQADNDLVLDVSGAGTTHGSGPEHSAGPQLREP